METKIYNNADTEIKEWFKAANIDDIPENSGACIKYKNTQIAIFNFTDRNEWYATQNMCPHKLEMALSRGIIGEAGEEPKVSCPFHKKSFSLKSGKCISGGDYFIDTYPVKIENNCVYIGITNEP